MNYQVYQHLNNYFIKKISSNKEVYFVWPKPYHILLLAKLTNEFYIIICYLYDIHNVVYFSLCHLPSLSYSNEPSLDFVALSVVINGVSLFPPYLKKKLFSHKPNF